MQGKPARIHFSPFKRHGFLTTAPLPFGFCFFAPRAFDDPAYFLNQALRFGNFLVVIRVGPLRSKQRWVTLNLNVRDRNETKIRHDRRKAHSYLGSVASEMRDFVLRSHHVDVGPANEVARLPPVRSTVLQIARVLNASEVAVWSVRGCNGEYLHFALKEDEMTATTRCTLSEERGADAAPVFRSKSWYSEFGPGEDV